MFALIMKESLKLNMYDSAEETPKGASTPTLNFAHLNTKHSRSSEEPTSSHRREADTTRDESTDEPASPDLAVFVQDLLEQMVGTDINLSVFYSQFLPHVVNE